MYVVTTAELDYIGAPFNLTFMEASTQSVPISIVDDDLVERTEVIQLLLTTLTPNVIPTDPNTAQIEIIDNDGEIFSSTMHHTQMAYYVNFNFSTDAVFEFSMTYYSVSEDSGVVSICLELINGTLTEDIIIQVMVVDSNNGMSGCK